MVKIGKVFTGLAGAVLAVSVFCGAAQAANVTPSKLHQYDYWGAYSYKASQKTVCYILSTPTKQAPSSVNHGDNFFLISKRGNAPVTFEPQFMAGYDLKAQSKVTAKVGNKSFELFTKGNSAWVAGSQKEKDLLTAMRGGNTMEINAVSKRGTNTSYTFSLKGVTAAVKSLQSCK